MKTFTIGSVEFELLTDWLLRGSICVDGDDRELS